jgi:hypothetical protein
MSYGSNSAIEIDRKLREDFRRRLKDFGILAESTDPVLAVLFRTFAHEIEKLYSETDRIRLALLDEFLANLRMQPRMAHPAQSVIRFFPDGKTPVVTVPGGTELNALAITGERLNFTTDVSVQVSNARIALAATYQDENIQLLPGVEMPEALQSARPSLDPVRVRLGPQPAIYLAIEGLPASHLSFHSVFFELGPDSFKIQRALETETWCIADSEGMLSSQGLLFPQRGNGGVRQLKWLVRPGEVPEESVPQEVPELPNGFYAGRTFVFPHVPPARRFVCGSPKAMGEALVRIFGRDSQRIFSTPRVWVRISLPEGLPSLHTGLGSVALHAVSASNVECFNQTIQFAGNGTSIPISREAGTKKYLVAPLSISGESESMYLPELQPSSDRCVGRYAVRNGRIELRPALHPEGKPEAYANVRVWLTDGALGNGVGPGQISGFAKGGPFETLRIANPVSAAGGTDDEGYSSARARIAETLLSRDRVVTEMDLITAVRAYDRRIMEAEVSSRLVRTPHGLRRVQQVTAKLDRDGFTDAAVEVELLKNGLTHHLETRLLHGTGLNLGVAWK